MTRAGGGRFGVRVGQPGVEREHGNFDCEGEEEAPEEPFLELQREKRVTELPDTSLDAEGVCSEVNRQDREQHQHRTSQRIEEKFDGRVEAAFAAPDSDEEVHRDEHHFPENVKEDEIERHENAEHAGLEEQQQDVVFLFAFLNCGPRRENRQSRQESS